MGSVNLFKRCKCGQYLLDDDDNFVDFKSELKIPFLTDKLFEILLCALHDDIRVLLFVILIPLHFGHEVSFVLNDPLAF